MPARTVCSQPGCPTLTDTGRCTEHRRAADRARGTRQERGYDAFHDRLRRHWAPKVANGTVTCTRCDQPIAPGTPWDLGHDETRNKHTGPEHATCNRTAGGQAAHQPPSR